jgi:hypothetical protein
MECCSQVQRWDTVARRLAANEMAYHTCLARYDTQINVKRPLFEIEINSLIDRQTCAEQVDWAGGVQNSQVVFNPATPVFYLLPLL